MVHAYGGLANMNLFMIRPWDLHAFETEDQLDEAIERVRAHTRLLKESIPRFRESVKQYAPHTIVGEHRRRARLLCPLTVIWHWLVAQRRKNLPAPTATNPPAE